MENCYLFVTQILLKIKIIHSGDIFLKTGAKVVAETLKSIGINNTFGMPGVQNLELIDAFIDYEIHNVLATSELSAAFMADGYNRVTGDTGVCIAIPGPGLTNMVTALAEAYLDSSSIVVLVIGIDEDGKSFHIHQINQLETIKPVVKAVIKITEISKLSENIFNAFTISQKDEPGPVVVEIPKKILREKAVYKPDNSSLRVQNTDIDNNDISLITDMLINSKSCGIYAGRGALSASQEITKLAEILSAPVATTISGKGAISEDHDLSVGFGFGPAGSKLDEKVFKDCELILAIGCKFSEMSTGSWSMEIPGTLIHIDQNRDVFDKNYNATISLCMDIKSALIKILYELSGRKKKENSRLLEKLRTERKYNNSGIGQTKSKDCVHPSRVFHELRKNTNRNTIFVTDCGNHQLWAILELQVLKPRTFLTPSDYQAMGFCLPAAIGAALSRPNEKVIGICGDGGFLINGFELLTAVREKLNIAIIIFNDGALGLIKNMQKKIYGRTSSVDFISPDYKIYSQSIGIDYVEIGDEDELEDGLLEMINNKGVVLVNIKIEYEQWPEYIDGAAKASWRKKPLSEKLRLLSNRIVRLVSSGR